MNKMTSFSMKNVAALFIIMLLVFVGGIFATTKLKVESMPDISFPIVVISTQYTAPPKDVLDQVTKPLEKAVAGFDGIKNLSSTSSDNYSQITIELDQDIKPKNAKQDLEALVSNVKLPQQAEKPKVLTEGFSSQPVYYLGVYGNDGMNQAELDKIYKDTILPGFNTIKGIDHVDSVGNQEATLSIKLNENTINSYGLTPTDVSNSIRAALSASPAGTVEFNGTTQMVRVTGQIDTIYGLDNLTLTTPKGSVLQLKDLGKIEAISESQFITRLDGKPAIGVQLYKTKSANAVNFADEADALMANWEKTLPGVKFKSVYNSAVEIKKSIHGMVQEGGMGALLASVMILLFLRNIRMTLIVLVSIPLSILITLLMMVPLNISLNIMTLGGMAIAVGRVVDDSIVVIENIYSQLQKAQERGESVIKLATAQVASAITSSTITTVGVFGPIAFVSGVIGEVFRPFALTLVVALLSSLLVALTVIPMLAKLLVLKSKKLGNHDENHVGKFALVYKRALEWSLNNRIKTLLFSGILFIASLVLIVPQLAVSYMPEDQSARQMIFQIKMPNDTSIETMDEKSKQLEQMMREAKDASGNPQFTYNESMVGYAFSSDVTPYRTMMFTEANENSNAEQVFKAYKEKILYELPKGSEVDGSLISASASGSSTDFSYSLKGDDMLYLKQAAAQVKEKMKEFPDLYEVKDSLSDSKTEVEVTVDQNKARLYGLSSAQVLEMVNSWIGVSKLGDLKFDNVTYETKVELDPQYKNSVNKIGTFLLKSPTGQTVQLNEIAKITQIDAPTAITRENQVQTLKVTAKIKSADKGGVSGKVAAELNALELPSGVSREVKGVSDDIASGFSEIFAAMGASIFIVYLVMVLAFGNASAPFAILFSLPLAVIGGLFGLLVTGESLNITSLIGFLMLIGIVVTNAIVLIDRVQQLRDQGVGVRESLISAGLTRLRPIIMTAGATVFALMPLALGMSKGTIISKGLAVVVIGGLVTSTVLTLVVVPIIYELIESFKRRSSNAFHRKPKKNKVDTVPAAKS
ncbi:swarming motility protein SwrC [Paenibacillus chitinolyticus]|uniref:efflux RND transporter permease subunit n=1 Tax=Paenibacillus chitinolyticus TaxID=79263 RepID=UPI0026E4FD06|nr:efflux RND transporter permease subunit [Paenibacillus chitinolyticus]GKS12557.1 swarming motility protein SwrC [Paenibacillus chitinolyticus]